MATASKIIVGIDDQVVELTGADKENFIADREATLEVKRLLETEQLAKQAARTSALTKLATIAGLTQEEIGAIL